MISFNAGYWAFRLIPDELNDRVDIWAFVRRGHNGAAILQPDGTTVEVEANEQLDGGDRKPVLSVPREALDSLMNSLWEMGVRPQGKRYEEETKLLREVLTTQGKHLEDMQQLVFEERRETAKGGSQ